MTDGAYLLADIGATHARFCLATAAGLSGEVVRLPSGDYSSSDALLDDVRAALPWQPPAAACIAIAGPVQNGRGRITNGTLAFDAGDVCRRLGCPVMVVNDFHAMARSLPELKQLRQIGGAMPASGVKAVLGPGTGLGMGLLVPRGRGWRVLASEGGHGDLAPGNALEAEILGLLQAAHGHVCWETVLSGPGLVRLYGAVCALWGTEAEAVSPEWITAHGERAEEPVCHQTLEIFFGLLGAAAGNLALTVWARGGVYLGGGILPGLADFAAESPLRRRFEERGALSEQVRAMPLYLILDEAPGLVGALECLREGGAAAG